MKAEDDAECAGELERQQRGQTNTSTLASVSVAAKLLATKKSAASPQRGAPAKDSSNLASKASAERTGRPQQQGGVDLRQEHARGDSETERIRDDFQRVRRFRSEITRYTSAGALRQFDWTAPGAMLRRKGGDERARGAASELEGFQRAEQTENLLRIERVTLETEPVQFRSIDDEAEHMGWLHFRGQVMTWKWTELYWLLSGGVLYGFEQCSYESEALHIIPVVGATVRKVMPSNRSHPFVFRLSVHHHYCEDRLVGSFEFAAPCSAERDGWLRELREEAETVPTDFRIRTERVKSAPAKKKPASKAAQKGPKSLGRGTSDAPRERRRGRSFGMPGRVGSMRKASAQLLRGGTPRNMVHV